MTQSAEGPSPVWVVYGTRPEVIKMAPVVAALKERPDAVEVHKVFSGQHRELAEDLFPALGMSPDLRLDLMRDDQTLAGLAGRSMTQFTRLIQDAPPEMVLVQGDTSTVFFASLSSYFEKVTVGHVEAGLRSFDKYAPFPEEMMRRLTDALADLHFAPTPEAGRNLRSEGIGRESIFVTGNTVIDTVRHAAGMSSRLVDQALKQWVERHPDFVVVTLHRRESFGSDMRSIMSAIASFAGRHPEIDFIYPVHPNPNLRDPVDHLLGDVTNVHLIDPVGYLEMVFLLKHCITVVTDSGGLQEEAPALGKHVLVARTVTERPEGVSEGVATLVGADPHKIQRSLEMEIDRGREAGPGPRATDETPYGDGRAGKRIADVVVHHLTSTPRRTDDWRPS